MSPLLPWDSQSSERCSSPVSTLENSAGYHWESFDELIEYYEDLIDYYDDLIEYYDDLIDYDDLIEYIGEIREYFDGLTEYYDDLIEYCQQPNENVYSAHLAK